MRPAGSGTSDCRAGAGSAASMPRASSTTTRPKRSCATISRAPRPTCRADSLTPRRLSFPTGHRAEFWRGNCLAVGLSAGFIEPLEASAIVMIELSLGALIDNFPASRAAMDVHAARFNALFRTRWDRVVEFLKLHYLLSRRDEPYWRAQRDPATVPPRLAELVELWRDQPPSSLRSAADQRDLPGRELPICLVRHGRRRAVPSAAADTGDARAIRPGPPAHAQPAVGASIQPRTARSARCGRQAEKVVQP